MNSKQLDLQKIQDMHSKFKIGFAYKKYGAEDTRFFYDAINEELDELLISTQEENTADMFDALIDILVFTLGQAEKMGLLAHVPEAYNRVQEANMKKVAGPTPEDKERYAKVDLIKPEGWQPADLSDLVADGHHLVQ